ncbi:MAG: hypothetical protein AB1545_11620 [Thermodesulfobacteriota bacterium]|jgi:hypothetical protein
MLTTHKSFSPEKGGLLTQNDQGGLNEEMLFPALTTMRNGQDSY